MAAYFTMRKASELPDIEFIKRALGGMAIRLGVVLTLMVVIILYLQVHLTAFILAYGAGMIAVLVIEVYLLKRQLPAATGVDNE